MKFRLLTIAVTLGSMAASLPVRAADIQQELDTSVRQTYINVPNGGKPHKFDEYQSRPNGFVLDRYSIDLLDPNYTLSCEARSANQVDQSYVCKGGQPGVLTYKVGYNQISHVFSHQARTGFVQTQTGVFKTPAALRAATAISLTPNGTQKLMNDFMATINGVPLGTREDIASLNMKTRLSPELVLSVDVARSHKIGSRAIGLSFGFSNAQELPEPIDWVTSSFKTGLDYATKELQLGLRYEFSDFRNAVGAIIWDNPQTNVDVYTAAKKETAVGRDALTPENDAHSFGLSGGYSLPWWSSRVSANVGYSRWHAVNPMLPMTTNTRMRTGAGAGIKCDLSNRADCGMDESIVSLMNIYTQEYRLSARPTRKLRGSLGYRSYILENENEEHVFDKGWSPYDGATVKTDIIEPEKAQFRKDRVELKADYELLESLSIGGGAGMEYEKKTREVNKSKEYTFEAGTTYRPMRKLFVNLSYLLGLRRMNGFDYQGYKNGTFSSPKGVFQVDIPGLLRFDVADRNRNRGRLQVQYAADNGATAGLSVLVNKDDFRPGKAQLDGGADNRGFFSNNQYGLLESRNYVSGLDASAPLGEWFNLDGYYEADFSRQLVRLNPNNGQLYADDITDRIDEFSHIGGIALEWLPTKTVKTLVGYDLVYSIMHNDPIANGGGASVVDARSWPATKRMLQRIKTSAGYKFTDNVELTARYAFEKFDVQDFALADVPNLVDSTTATGGTNLTFLGASLRGYYAHSVAMGVNYKF